jgi:hypothetical protein
MAKHKIRLSLDPDREYEVEGPELLDLQRQGLVLSDRRATAPVERRTRARRVARATRTQTEPTSALSSTADGSSEAAQTPDSEKS